jgi:hypothetical protein
MRKFLATFLTLLLLLQLTPLVLAKPKGDWNAVKALEKRTVAVKTTKGTTYYGLMWTADDDSIMVHVAGKNDFTGQELSLRRDEITKVWRARLRFNERNIERGGWIGAGVGFLSLVAIAAVAARGTETGEKYLFAAWLPFTGATAGAIIGAFWKKKHKKQELVYSI